MRKRMIKQQTAPHSGQELNWLNLENLTEVELTSEDDEHPIESALIPGSDHGWRAAQAGEQTIQLIFLQPQVIRHIRLLFHENSMQRTQQFTLRWSGDSGDTYEEIVRQQYNFNPSDATEEIEDYQLHLDGVTSIELSIIPDISGGDAVATLKQLQLA